MNRILKLIAVFLSITLISAGVCSADQGKVDSSATWAGLDLGIFAAYSWDKLNYSEPDYAGYDRHPQIKGFTGGILVGHHWQVEPVVFGVEADMGWRNLDEGASNTALNDYSAFEVKWNSHVRVKAGYAVDSALFFIAGGIAIAEVEVNDIDGGWGDDTGRHLGWTLGGGIEYQITRHLTTRLEYLYDDYGTEQYELRSIAASGYRADVDMTSQTIRLGLSYSF